MSGPDRPGAQGPRPLTALVAPPGPAVLRALRAALGDGPALLPLAPDLPAPVLRGLLAALHPTDLVDADGAHRQLHDGVGVPESTALVVATSGSTGAPRGVLLSDRALRAAASASLRRLGAGSGRWVACLPVQHVGGLLVLVRALLAGHEPVWHARFDVAAVAEGGGDHVALVPTMLGRLLDAGVDLGRFATLLLGGAAAPRPLLERAREAGARVVTTYGLTESAGGCVYDGEPLDDVDVRLDPTGGIHLAGPVLCDGYRDGSTPVHDGWLATADLGRFDGAGRLQVLGRADDVIVTGGENVAAARVEQLVAEAPGVAEVAVVGRPDVEWGQRVVAVVVADRGVRLDAEAVRHHVAAVAARHEVPREVRVVDALPLLPGGKVDRVALREGRHPS